MAASLQVVEGPEAVRYLADPDYDVVPYHDRVAALAARLRLDFGNILYLLDHLPLALRGAAHAGQRADVARLVAERRPQVVAALPGMIATHFAALSHPGPCDLLNQSIKPVVEAMIACLIEADLSHSPANLVSRVFSQAMGVAQRREMDRELAGLRHQIALAHPGEPDLRQGTRLALVVLGRDAMIGTIARSLHDHFLVLGDRPLNALPLPEVPTHTGVPYIDREAKADAGDLRRCYLQALEGAGPSERLRFFGAGAHVCLGRVLALDLFQHLSAHLAQQTTRIRVDSFHLRKDDVFALPDVFAVEVAP